MSDVDDGSLICCRTLLEKKRNTSPTSWLCVTFYDKTIQNMAFPIHTDTPLSAETLNFFPIILFRFCFHFCSSLSSCSSADKREPTIMWLAVVVFGHLFIWPPLILHIRMICKYCANVARNVAIILHCTAIPVEVDKDEKSTAAIDSTRNIF